MPKLRKNSRVGYEDLMQELSTAEQSIRRQDRAAAMSLMVLEAKMRERFQRMEYRLLELDPSYFASSEPDEASPESIDELIPKELRPFPAFAELEARQYKRRLWETVGLAALMAVLTALGVFGLASLLHLALSFVA